MQVRHILREKGRDVIAISSAATLSEAARVLSEKKIGALITTDKIGALEGIFSERDLVHAIAARGRLALADPVAAHMTRGPATCIETDSVETIMEIMTQGRFRHVPVLDDAMRLCGLVSIGDVVKAHIAETTREAAALRDYISASL